MNKSKITLSQLGKFLMKAADIFRGKMDASEYKEFIFGMLSLDYQIYKARIARLCSLQAGPSSVPFRRNGLLICVTTANARWYTFSPQEREP
jgi:hypothetical protein